MLCCSNHAAALQISKQSQKHAAQMEAFKYAVGSRRPAKPHCSKELLNQRRVIDLLARQGCYSKAAAVQQATDGMEAAEMKATLATFEAEVGCWLVDLQRSIAQIVFVSAMQVVLAPCVHLRLFPLDFVFALVDCPDCIWISHAGRVGSLCMFTAIPLGFCVCIGDCPDCIWISHAAPCWLLVYVHGCSPRILCSHW